MSLTFFSDGGGIRDAQAAGACIIENEAGERARLIAYLGGATNNEAEITAGLLGFAFVRATGLLPEQVRWVADSEYALKSATGYIFGWQKNGWKTAAKKPVKNQGLWRSFLSLSKGVKIVPEHVRGHTGHEENEAVDSASTWAQKYAEELFEDGAAGKFVEPFHDGDVWLLLDARKYIEALRSDGEINPSNEELLFLSDALEELGVSGFAEFAGDGSSIAPVDKDALTKKRIGKKLKDVAKEASTLSDGENSKTLRAAIKQLIKDFELS